MDKDIEQINNKPSDYNDQLDSYLETLKKSKNDELPKWGDQTQFEVAMDDLKNLADGNWNENSKLEGAPLSLVAEHHHKGWKKEDFANLHKDILNKVKQEEEVMESEPSLSQKNLELSQEKERYSLKEIEEKLKGLGIDNENLKEIKEMVTNVIDKSVSEAIIKQTKIAIEEIESFSKKP